jgi:alcohol dehydrogenase YqhD (iron-dependent ADH family)
MYKKENLDAKNMHIDQLSSHPHMNSAVQRSSRYWWQHNIKTEVEKYGMEHELDEMILDKTNDRTVWVYW